MNGGRIPWNVTECPLTDQKYRLEQWSNIIVSMRKDISRLHPFDSTVLPGIFLGYEVYVGGIWKGGIMIEDIEELEKVDASELHARRLNAKKC